MHRAEAPCLRLQNLTLRQHYPLLQLQIRPWGLTQRDQDGEDKWWWRSGRDQEGLHGGSDLGLFLKILQFGLQIMPYL